MKLPSLSLCQLKLNVTAPDESLTIYLRYTQNRKPNYISVSSIPAKYWTSDKLHPISKKAPNSRQLNEYLEQELQRGKKILLEMEREGVDINFDNFKIRFNQVTSIDFYQFIAEEIKRRTSSKRYSTFTLKGYDKELSLLKKYYPILSLKQISTTFIEKYKQKLFEKGLAGSTVWTRLKFVKTMFNAAKNQGLVAKQFNPFEGVMFEPKYKKKQTLTFKELMALDKLYRQEKEKSSQLSDNLITTLEYYLFMSYTGLPFGDIKSLEWKHIESVKHEGKEYFILKKIRSKTDNPFYIPLSDLAVAILPKRRDGLIFDVFSLQATNRHLKTVMQVANITKNLSTHTARHNFATNSLHLGIDKYTLQRLLAHSRISMTEVYTTYSNTALIRAVNDNWNTAAATTYSDTAIKYARRLLFELNNEVSPGDEKMSLVEFIEIALSKGMQLDINKKSEHT